MPVRYNQLEDIVWPKVRCIFHYPLLFLGFCFGFFLFFILISNSSLWLHSSLLIINYSQWSLLCIHHHSSSSASFILWLIFISIFSILNHHHESLNHQKPHHQHPNSHVSYSRRGCHSSSVISDRPRSSLRATTTCRRLTFPKAIWARCEHPGLSCKAFWEVDHLEAFLFHVEVGRNGSCAPHCHSCQPDVLRYASTDLLSDTGFLKEFLQAHHGLPKPNSYHEWASEELQSVCRDREFMLHAVRQNGQALSWVSPDLCNDYDLVSTAVSKNGLAYHRSCAYDRENTFPRTHRSLNIRFVKYHPRAHDSFSLRFVRANTNSIPKKKRSSLNISIVKYFPRVQDSLISIC